MRDPTGDQSYHHAAARKIAGTQLVVSVSTGGHEAVVTSQTVDINRATASKILVRDSQQRINGHVSGVSRATGRMSDDVVTTRSIKRQGVIAAGSIECDMFDAVERRHGHLTGNVQDAIFLRCRCVGRHIRAGAAGHDHSVASCWQATVDRQVDIPYRIVRSRSQYGNLVAAA